MADGRQGSDLQQHLPLHDGELRRKLHDAGFRILRLGRLNAPLGGSLPLGRTIVALCDRPVT